MTQVARIKGYLPVRIQLPTEDGTRDETFVYVKEHTENASSRSTTSTLFVVNAPVVPGLSTRILLKALFGSWADIQRVTVVSHASHVENSRKPSWLKKSEGGSYAHIVYENPQAFKQTMKALEKHPNLTLDAAELQTLQDATVEEDNDDNVDRTDHVSHKNKKHSIVLELAKRYRRTIPDREELLEECNQIMEEFEEATETLRLERERAANEPDEDGFVTVTYNNSNSALEVQQQSSGRKRASSKSSRHRKKQKKKCEDLTDFYRFQNKQQKKDALQQLRQQFQHDVEKVKKLRENFQPF